MDHIFLEVSLILIVATVTGVLAKVLRQPIIPAYILAGILLGPSAFNVIQSAELLEVLSRFGIAFLLFLVGIELDLRKFLKIGRVAIVAGFMQMTFAVGAGYVLIRILGFNSIEAILLALALGFSSTIIGLKLIGEKKELDTLYGQIVIGMMLTQDFIAVFILLFFDVFTVQTGITIETVQLIGEIIVKAVVLFSVALLSAKFVLQRVFTYFANSAELLFLGAISWCLVFALLAMYFGFSIEVGSLLAGVSLSLLPYSYEISYRIKSLRDFFLPVFFAVLGGQLVFTGGMNIFGPALILSLLVLVASPLLVMVVLIWMGYRARTGVQAGIAISQISEFSFILMALAFSKGVIDHDLVTLVASIGLITMTVSSYMFEYSDNIYALFGKWLKRFERGRKEDTVGHNDQSMKGHIILFGFHALGDRTYHALTHAEQSVVVVDHNPNTIEVLKKQNIPHMYGSMSDDEVLDRLCVNAASAVISTVHSTHDTLELLEYIQHHDIKTKVIVTAFTIADALYYYKRGAHYVIVPPIVSASYATDIITYTARHRKTHIRTLEELQEMNANI